MNEEKSAKSRRQEEFARGAHPNVDRLIELASDEKPAEILIPEDGKDSREKSMWKILLQLKPFLPYLARLVPLLDIAVGPVQNAGLSNEVRESVAKIQAIQREVSAAVQDQSLELKLLNEQIAQLRQASERQTAAQAKLAEELKSVGSLVRIAAIGLGILSVVLIVMTGVLLAHVGR
jgi:hypothetical protein